MKFNVICVELKSPGRVFFWGVKRSLHDHACYESCIRSWVLFVNATVVSDQIQFKPTKSGFSFAQTMHNPPTKGNLPTENGVAVSTFSTNYFVLFFFFLEGLKKCNRSSDCPDGTALQGSTGSMLLTQSNCLLVNLLLSCLRLQVCFL